MFTTFDKDHDEASSNCAEKFSGGWWFRNCKFANLNGLYYSTNPITDKDGIDWKDWRGNEYSLKTTEMKIRRL